MSDGWISPAVAISKIAKALSIEEEKAIWPLWQLARNRVVRTRISEVSDADGNSPLRDVPMRKQDWEDIARLGRNDWFAEGRAYFPDDIEWRDCPSSDNLRLMAV